MQLQQAIAWNRVQHTLRSTIDQSRQLLLQSLLHMSLLHSGQLPVAVPAPVDRCEIVSHSRGGRRPIVGPVSAAELAAAAATHHSVRNNLIDGSTGTGPNS